MVREQEVNIRMRDQILKQTDHFKYHGVCFGTGTMRPWNLIMHVANVMEKWYHYIPTTKRPKYPRESENNNINQYIKTDTNNVNKGEREKRKMQGWGGRKCMMRHEGFRQGRLTNEGMYRSLVRKKNKKNEVKIIYLWTSKKVKFFFANSNSGSGFEFLYLHLQL